MGALKIKMPSAPQDSPVPVALSLDGVQRLKLYDTAKAAIRIHSAVERAVARTLLEKIFPVDLREGMAVPGRPGVYGPMLRELAAEDVPLDEAERALLAEALQVSCAMQGFLDDDADWYFGLIELLKEKK